MCDCENMTTSVRDEKIALVFETVFEEQASDEGEVTAHPCTLAEELFRNARKYDVYLL